MTDTLMLEVQQIAAEINEKWLIREEPRENSWVMWVPVLQRLGYRGGTNRYIDAVRANLPPHLHQLKYVQVSGEPREVFCVALKDGFLWALMRLDNSRVEEGRRQRVRMCQLALARVLTDVVIRGGDGREASQAFRAIFNETTGGQLGLFPSEPVIQVPTQPRATTNAALRNLNASVLDLGSVIGTRVGGMERSIDGLSAVVQERAASRVRVPTEYYACHGQACLELLGGFCVCGCGIRIVHENGARREGFTLEHIDGPSPSIVNLAPAWRGCNQRGWKMFWARKWKDACHHYIDGQFVPWLRDRSDLRKNILNVELELKRRHEWSEAKDYATIDELRAEILPDPPTGTSVIGDSGPWLWDEPSRFST